MTEWISERRICCPFCGQSITVVIDGSAGSQSYVEDCEICCRPMQISVQISVQIPVEVDDGTVVTVEVDRAD